MLGAIDGTMGPETGNIAMIAYGIHGPFIRYNVRPPRYLSWFITSITMVYGTYNYSYWGL